MKIFIILFLFILGLFASTVKCNDNSHWDNHLIDTLMDIDLNGTHQKILIQANDTSNPVLLYLHGGPGSPTMMLSHAYSGELMKKSIFVNWDQRGAGLSYYDGMDSTHLSENQIILDALELTKYLVKTYHKKKIFLLGHSFGSVIGIRLVEKYPEYFHAYVGVGQVIDWEKSVEMTSKWLRNEMIKANDTAGLIRIKEITTSRELIEKYGGYTLKPVNFDSIIKKSPYYFEGYIEYKKKAKQFTKKYMGRFNNHSLTNELRKSSSDTVSFYNIKELKVPLYFFEGRYDHVQACAPELVAEFCNQVKAPNKEIIWFENSGHLPNLEEPAKFQEMLIKILKY